MSPPLDGGGIAIISQSGGLLLAYHRLAQQRAIRLAYTVSIGNEAMCMSSDFLLEFVRRGEVRVIGALLEGIRDPAGFVQTARAALAARKPVVVLKVSGGQAGARAIVAHTGSLASSDSMVEAVFRQLGVIRVNTVEELIETCALLDRAGWPSGGKTAVITTSGGACGVVSHLAHGTRVELPDYSPETKRRLARVLPVFGTPQNPLDTTGVIVNEPRLLAACVDAVAAEDTYDALLINSDPPREPGANSALIDERMSLLADAVKRAPMFTALAQTVAGDLTPYGRESLVRHGLHFANGLALGLKAVDHAIFYGHAAARPAPPIDRPTRSRPSLQLGSGALSESAGKELLAAYGIPSPVERLAQTRDEAARVATEIGFPVVVKVQSPDIPHKTDAGGIRLHLANEVDVRAAFDAVVACQPGARIEGVLVSRQVEPVAELIAGINVDPVFGPVVMVGLGGIFVETFQDVSMRLPPLGESMAVEMLHELKGAAILQGARGRPRADLGALAAVLVQLGELALDLGDRLQALDVNPVFALSKGALAGDALVVLAEMERRDRGGPGRRPAGLP